MGSGKSHRRQDGGDIVSILLHLQNAILRMIAKGAGLESTCNALCSEVECILPDVICSVLTVDREGLLHPLAGPSLPDIYSQALHGVMIGPLVGSCGTAAYLRKDVTAVDIETDVRWAEFKHLARPHGLRACRSSPIYDADGRVIATFAFYYLEVRGPTAFEREVVANCVHLTQIAIDRHERVLEHQRRAFTDTLTGHPNRAAYHAALSELEGSAAVAEGIETEEQVKQLRAIGCMLGQGYVFSRAVDRDTATGLLLEHGQRISRPARKP
jgi:GAF domain-containing protein